MIAIEWGKSTKPVLQKAGFKILKLSNGETVGAMCKSDHTGNYSTTQTNIKIHKTKKDAEKSLLRKASARVWFLTGNDPKFENILEPSSLF